MRKRRVAIGLGTAAAVLALALPALAATSSGHQNPDLTVKTTLTSSHVGTKIVVTGVAVMTNATSRTVRASYSAELDGTSSGQGVGTPPAGLRAGASVSHTFRISAAARGTYKLSVTAKDPNGTSSAHTSLTVK